MSRLTAAAFFSAWIVSVSCMRSRAQEPVPIPPAPGPPPAPASEDLEQRVRQLEALVRSMASTRSERERQLEERIRELESRLASGAAGAANSAAPGAAPGGFPPGTPPAADPEEEITRGGSAGLSPTDPGDPADMPAPAENRPLTSAKFGPGFQFADADEEFVIQFHDLTQVDGRFDLEGGAEDVRDTFGIPRQWFIFNGRLTRPFEYFVAINEGFDNLNLLDAYLNVHYIDAVQLKVGRYKTPFTYEFYSLPAPWLINPERSQFFNNFGLNREVGLMLWGQLFEKQMDYAVGIFNGTRNGFLDFDNGKDVAALVNFLPFLKRKDSPLAHLNVGGSLNAGGEFAPQVPNRLRLNVPTQANTVIGVPFLMFAPNVLDSGQRSFWSLHMGWYYRAISLIAEWQSGYQFLALQETPLDRIRVPVQSYYVQLGYFLTGEEVEDRGPVRPERPMGCKNGAINLGALELALRYNYLDISRNVFTGGLADPDLWTNQVQTIDVGFNWYWTQYIKTYFGWQHAIFADPVLSSTNPDRFQDASDLFWFRFQVYF